MGGRVTLSMTWITPLLAGALVVANPNVPTKEVKAATIPDMHPAANPLNQSIILLVQT